MEQTVHYENEIKGSISHFLLNQAIKEHLKEVIKHVVCRIHGRLSKTNIYKVFLLEYQSFNYLS